MGKLKIALVLSVVLGLAFFLPAAFSQAAAETPSDRVTLAAKGGNGHGPKPGSSTGPGTDSASGKQTPSQNQVQATERLEARKNAPDKVKGQSENRIMENARGTLKQIREQTGEQSLAGEKWQELRGQINQIKELRQVTKEEARAMIRECLELAKEKQNLAEQERYLEDLVEIDPADREAYKALGETYRKNGKQGVKVFLNGVGIKFDVPPVIKEGRTLVPVRAITEGFGATVIYDPENKTVTITKGETTIVLTLGQNVALVNGREVTLDARAELNNSRTIVPLRFIAETFKLNVDNPDEDIVTVSNPATDPGTVTNTGSGTEGSTGTTTGSTTEGTAAGNSTGSTTESSTETSAGTAGGETAEEGTTQNTASQNTTTNPQQP
ncbi:MAG: hypothetical protein K6T29_01335 [Peptococcaceae bacterium]|nr:hypothetical protein [Peptococcaceae bacterium]